MTHDVGERNLRGLRCRGVVSVNEQPMKAKKKAKGQAIRRANEKKARPTPSQVAEHLHELFIFRGADPRLALDRSLRELSNRQLRTVLVSMLDVLFRRRGIEVQDMGRRGQLLEGLRVFSEAERVLEELLLYAENLNEIKRASPETEKLERLYRATWERINRISKAVFGVSPERHARVVFLQCLHDATERPRRPVRFDRYGGAEMLSAEQVATMSPSEIEARGYSDPSPGWWVRRDIGFHQFDGLTLDDYDEAVKIMAKAENARKWKELARYIAKAGMGNVAPASLAADWRKFRAGSPPFHSEDEN